MATNLALDDNLIQEALEVGHHKTKKEAVTQALINYIRSLRQRNILASFGKVSFENDYDYKKGRHR